MIHVTTIPGIAIEVLRVKGRSLEFRGVYVGPDGAGRKFVDQSGLILSSADGRKQDFPLKPFSSTRESVMRKRRKVKDVECTRFVCPVDLGALDGPAELAWKGDDDAVARGWAGVRQEDYSPLSDGVRGTCLTAGRWLVRQRGRRLLIGRASRAAVLSARLAWWFDLLVHPGSSSAKVLVLKAVTWWHSLSVRKRPLWLFADRVNKADDNGRALFEYCASLPKTEDSPRMVFAIQKGAPEEEELRKVGEVIDILSLKYKAYFMLADFIISAYRTKAQRMPFSMNVLRRLKPEVNHAKFVYLRHGISYNDLSADVGIAQVNARILCTSTPQEYESIFRLPYGYSRDEARLVGMPRYDRLYDASTKSIVMMPTWRRTMVTRTHAFEHEALAGFEDSTFCRTYRALFNDSRLRDACARLGYSLELMMHPNMVAQIKDFAPGEHVRILPLSTRYRDVFASAGIVLTDYSSVAFDVAYLKKPVVYFQFDKDEFFGEQYVPGYFITERDGFGEVEYTVDAVVDRLIEYMENGAKMKPEYVARVERFFAFTDRNNCKRVHEAILDVLGE